MSCIQWVAIFVCLFVLPEKIQSCQPNQPSANAAAPAAAAATAAPAAQAAATATCTQCTDAQLPTLTLQDAINAGLNGGQPGNQALSVTRPATTAGVDGAGCNTLTPNCPQPGELLVIRVTDTANPGSTDTGVYNPGTNTFVCNAGNWVNSATVVQPGLCTRAGITAAQCVVTGFECVFTQQAQNAANAAAG